MSIYYVSKSACYCEENEDIPPEFFLCTKEKTMRIEAESKEEAIRIYSSRS